MMTVPQVKVFCISSVQESLDAIALGASALGLVSAMPSGPGVVVDAVMAEIISAVPPAVQTFLLLSATSADVIIARGAECR